MAVTDCDLYLDWHTGSDGNLITDAIAAGSCRPTSPVDVPDAYPGSTLTAMKIESDSASPISGLVKCDGVTYDIGDTTQGAIYSHASNYEDMVTADFTTAPNVMSMGFLFKTGLHEEWEWHALSGMVGSGEWALLAPRFFESALHLYLHTSLGYSGSAIIIENNTWYWATIQYNRTAGYGYLAVYLASTMEQVGSTVSLAFGGSPSAVSYWTVGQHASQGNTEASSTWYGPVIFDWTDGTFPLLPGTEEQPQDWVEILVRAVDGTCYDPTANPLRGMPVVVKPKGHVWGSGEGPPEYMIVKVTSVTPDFMDPYARPRIEEKVSNLFPRSEKYTLTDARVAIRAFSKPFAENDRPIKLRLLRRREFRLAESLLNMTADIGGTITVTPDRFQQSLIRTAIR